MFPQVQNKTIKQPTTTPSIETSEKLTSEQSKMERDEQLIGQSRAVLTANLEDILTERTKWSKRDQFLCDKIVRRAIDDTGYRWDATREVTRRMIKFFVQQKFNDAFSYPLVRPDQTFQSFYSLGGGDQIMDSIVKCLSVSIRDTLLSFFTCYRFMVLVTCYDRISSDPTIVNGCYWNTDMDEQACVVHYGDHVVAIAHIYAINVF